MGVSRRQFILGAAGAGLVLLSKPSPKIIPAWGSSLAFGASIKYVSNRTTLGGNGTISNPYRVSEIWSHAVPGDEFIFLNGLYQGATSMLDANNGGGEGVSGTAQAWLYFHAETDGQVTFDGQGSMAPIRLAGNTFVIVEGFNACNSANGAVVSATRFSSGTNLPCQWIQFRKICAWDGPINTNHHVWSINGATNVLIEDCAGWGGGRKIFEVFQGGSGTSGGYGGGGATLRRCWGEWNKFGTTSFGPQHTFSISYWYTNVIAENLIGTWNTEPGFSANNPYDIFGHDGTLEANIHSIKLLGSIAYLRQGQVTPIRQMILFYYFLANLELRDNFACIGAGSGLKGILPFFTANTTQPGYVLRDCRAVPNGTPSSIGTGWTITNFTEGTTPGVSASSLVRYIDGVKTTQPLLPWPMNQRIIDARKQSGRSAVDVTATVQEICGGGAGDNTPPASPSNLRVS